MTLNEKSSFTKLHIIIIILKQVKTCGNRDISCFLVQTSIVVYPVISPLGSHQVIMVSLSCSQNPTKGLILILFTLVTSSYHSLKYHKNNLLFSSRNETNKRQSLLKFKKPVF